MITEDGAVRTSAKFDKKLYGQINGKNLANLFIMLFVSAALLAAMLVLIITGYADTYRIILTACAGILLVCSAFLITVSLLGRKKLLARKKYNVCELYAEYMTVKEFEGDSFLSEEKVYYDNLYRRRESKDFFLLYINRNAVHPVGKEGLSEGEKETVRRLLGLPQKSVEGAEVKEG